MKKSIILIATLLLQLYVQADTWDGSASDKSWYDQTKTEFYISNAAQLKGLADLVNEDSITFEDKTIFLKNDIDLSNNLWVPIGFGVGMNKGDRPFKGVFDGLEHHINNLFIDNSLLSFYPSLFIGLFGLLYDGTIKNLRLQGVININQGYCYGIGGLLARGLGESKINNIYCKTIITVKKLESNCSIGNTAGLVQTMSNIRSEGEIHLPVISQAHYGGIVGLAEGDLNECYSNVNIYYNDDRKVHLTTNCFGGIAGEARNITNSIFTGRFEIYDKAKNVVSGGICARASKLNSVISAPSYYYCNTDMPAFKGVIAPPSTSYQTAYYLNAYDTGTTAVGTGVSEDYLKSGAVLSGFDTNIWDFKSGKYPRIKSLIPTYAINAPTEHGSIGYCVIEGGDAKIKINSNAEWDVDKVFVNQMDETSHVNGNLLVFEDIQENKDIFVVYKQTSSGVKNISENDFFCISRSADGFMVSGVQPGKTITVYDMNGMELTRQSSNKKNNFDLPKGFYIVKACGQSKKVSY